MDELDQRLLALLRHNGRRSVSDLALELGVSRVTVRTRIDRMEHRGDIIGYTVILRADAVSAPVRGITLIEVEGRATGRIVDALGGLPEVIAVHTTNGKWDLVVELGAQSLTDLDAILARIRMRRRHRLGDELAVGDAAQHPRAALTRPAKTLA
jgi:DNA-binding Lrp family transcriptional regulator